MMKKLLLTLTTFALTCLQLSAQLPGLQWAQGVGSSGADIVNSIATDAAGNIYSVGSFYGIVDLDNSSANYTVASNGQSDLYILKTDASGNFIWAKSFGGTSYDSPVSISINSVGEIVLLGTFRNTVDFDPSAATVNITSTGIDDIFIAKYTSAGNYINAVKIGGTATDTPRSMTIMHNTDDIVIVGSFQGVCNFNIAPLTTTISSAGFDDIFFASYSNSLTLNWAKSLGGNTTEYATSVDADANNNVFVSGCFNGSIDFDPGAQTNTLTSFSGSPDIFVAKYDNLGNYLMAFNLGTTSTDGPSKLIVDPSDNIYVGGYVSGNVVDYDPGPATASINPVSAYRYGFIAKYSNSGAFTWVKAISSNYSTGVEVRALALDANNNVIVGGIYSGSVQVQGPFTNYEACNGGNDIFVVSYDNAGNYNYHSVFGGTGYEDITKILCASNSYLASGAFENTVDFDLSAATSTLISSGAADGYIAKYSMPLPTTLSAKYINSSVSIYPNPTGDILNITPKETNDVKISKIKLMDITGQQIFEKEFIGPADRIDLKDIPKGIYFLKIENNKEIIIDKIIKD